MSLWRWPWPCGQPGSSSCGHLVQQQVHTHSQLLIRAGGKLCTLSAHPCFRPPSAGLCFLLLPLKVCPIHHWSVACPSQPWALQPFPLLSISQVRRADTRIRKANRLTRLYSSPVSVGHSLPCSELWGAGETHPAAFRCSTCPGSLPRSHQQCDSLSHSCSRRKNVR
jgi:hypothetical protein